MAGEAFAPLEPVVARRPCASASPQGLPLEPPRRHGQHRLSPRRLPRLEKRRRADLPTKPSAIRRYACGQRQRRHRAAGGLRDASRPAQAARRRHRSECAGAHRARLRGFGRRLCRDAARSGRGLFAPWTRGLPALDALLMPTTADRRADASRRSPTRRYFAARNAAVLRNTQHRQFLRSLRGVAAAAGGASGRAYGGGAQRPGSPAAADRRGGEAAFCAPDRCLPHAAPVA